MSFEWAVIAGGEADLLQMEGSLLGHSKRHDLRFRRRMSRFDHDKVMLSWRRLSLHKLIVDRDCSAKSHGRTDSAVRQDYRPSLTRISSRRHIAWRQPCKGRSVGRLNVRHVRRLSGHMGARIELRRRWWLLGLHLENRVRLQVRASRNAVNDK